MWQAGLMQKAEMAGAGAGCICSIRERYQILNQPGYLAQAILGLPDCLMLETT